MSEFLETDDRRAVLKNKPRQYFDGKIVRKDLTKKIKEGANVPVYVLEFLLGQYCSSDDPEIIEQGVANVKHILADNFVRPDEAQKILSVLRQRGSHTVIDMITVNLDIKHDCYVSEFSNLGLKGIPIDEEYPTKYDRCLIRSRLKWEQIRRSWIVCIAIFPAGRFQSSVRIISQMIMVSSQTICRNLFVSCGKNNMEMPLISISFWVRT